MRTMKLGVWSAVTGLLLIAQTTITVLGQGGPPFRAGQVVVAGHPASLAAGETVLKYLPHANLTVIQVRRHSWNSSRNCKPTSLRRLISIASVLGIKTRLLVIDAVIFCVFHCFTR